MPIKFVSLNKRFIFELQQCYGYEAHIMKIEDYVPDKKTYYVSPANSLCFFDGGIDMVLSRIIFPNIEKKVKQIVKDLNIRSLVGKNYLPIGSSIIIDHETNINKSLIVSPTMLLPQDVSNTKNAYYSTMAVLYNILINKKENIDNVDIIFTSLCCGYGKMDEMYSITQIMQGINDYKLYNPTIINENIIIHEPNLQEQPKYYQNSEWFDINPSEIENVYNSKYDVNYHFYTISRFLNKKYSKDEDINESQYIFLNEDNSLEIDEFYKNYERRFGDKSVNVRHYKNINGKKIIVDGMGCGSLLDDITKYNNI